MDVVSLEQIVESDAVSDLLGDLGKLQHHFIKLIL